jgi:hypothetical protein
MPMTEMRIGDQTVRYDRDATVAVYGTLERGGAEACGCSFRKNFSMQRSLVSPASFRTLLEQLGIDASKEYEVFEYGPAGFQFFFTSVGPNAAAFRGGPRLTLEFTTHVKWLL